MPVLPFASFLVVKPEIGVWPPRRGIFSFGKNNSLRSDIFFPAEKAPHPVTDHTAEV